MSPVSHFFRSTGDQTQSEIKHLAATRLGHVTCSVGVVVVVVVVSVSVVVVIIIIIVIVVIETMELFKYRGVTSPFNKR